MSSAARREGAPNHLEESKHWKPDHRKTRKNDIPKKEEGMVEVPMPVAADKADELLFGGTVARAQKENARIEEIKRAIEEELEK